MTISFYILKGHLLSAYACWGQGAGLDENKMGGSELWGDGREKGALGKGKSWERRERFRGRSYGKEGYGIYIFLLSHT